MQDERTNIDVIILSGTESSGIDSDYFSINRGNPISHMNQLPLVHKSLIGYIVQDINKYIKGKKIIVVKGEEDESNYNKLLSKYKIKNIKFSYEQRPRTPGIISVLDNVIKSEDISDPFLVWYGDSIFYDDLLQAILSIKQNENIIFAMGEASVNDTITHKQDRYPHLIVNKIITTGKLPAQLPQYYIIDDIYDIVNSQISDISIWNDPELNFNPQKYKVFNMYGLMLLNKSCWTKFRKYRNPDSTGFYSIPYTLNQALIMGEDIPLLGIAKRTSTPSHFKECIDINYPWEYLKTNNFISTSYLEYNIRKETNNHYNLISSIETEIENIQTTYKELWKKFQERNETNYNRLKNSIIKMQNKLKINIKIITDLTHPDFKDTDYMVCNDIMLKSLFPQLPPTPFSFDQENYDYKYHREPNDSNSNQWFVSPLSKINGRLAIPKDIDKLYIGDMAHIDGFCVFNQGVKLNPHSSVRDSILGSDVLVDTYSLVDHSVILDNTKIYSHSIVPYSIIGNNVLISGDVVIACEPLLTTKENVYFSATKVIKFNELFGAIIGDDCRIGMKSFIQPGKKIGRNSNVYPGSEIYRDYPPNSIIGEFRSKRGAE